MENFAPFSAQAWSYAGQMTLLGMGMIFAVLSLLLIILMIFKVIFNSGTKKKKTGPAVLSADKSAEVIAKAEDVNVEPEVQPDPPDTEDTSETVAVIMAAIAAYMAEQGVPEDGFRVVSFRRENKGRAWNNK